MNQFLNQILTNQQIPSPPSVAAKLLDLVTQPDPDVSEIVRVLSADPTLSARLITYCNSPIIGSKRVIGSLQQAVMVLGMRTIRLLSLSFSLMETKGQSDFDYGLFWRRSLALGIASKRTREQFSGNGDEAFLLGLVFNVGQIGIGNTFPEKVIEIAGESALTTGLTVQQEEDTFELNRYQVGAKMLENWNFPSEMVDFIAEFQTDAVSEQDKQMVVSQLMADLLLSEAVTEELIAEVRGQASDLLDLDHDQFGELFDLIVADWKSYESIFNYKAIEFDSIEEMEAKAKESMLQISLGMETEIQRISVEKEELAETALVDSLTKLKNRAAYDAELADTITYQAKLGKGVGLIVIDIDHFKSVNDTYGHATGDEVLRSVGQCLSANVRTYDNVYRFGGEEFVVVVLDCDSENLKGITEKIQKSHRIFRDPT